ncbi:ArsR family transcriptional regulator [Hansschlegelia sp. KR7-227]|uniref:ArsR family transcriptional regulator n=1 Tax=Hansschlegelia zhihuaiae TaxID=405005 RepID=A0A4Q0ME15_9HYPH|nr:ArsR family transcriptional regulator [Hansschlegelia zhihuaiae]
MTAPSSEDVLRALTPENCRLIALIHRHRPSSVTELCSLAGRPQSNVSRSLAALGKVGLVSLVGGRPKRPHLATACVTISLHDLKAE